MISYLNEGFNKLPMSMTQDSTTKAQLFAEKYEETWNEPLFKEIGSVKK